MLRARLSEYVLEIVEGPDSGRQISLDRESMEIGRETESGIEIASDTLISRRHARLTPTADGVVVEDLGSRNGTFVDGDKVTIGVTVLELRTIAQARERTAVRPVPVGLTALRTTAVTPPVDPVPAGGLAAEERRPDYVAPEVARRDSPLAPLLDIHTKRMARTAPLAIFVIVALIVIVALALR
jgi:hypothetical protein